MKDIPGEAGVAPAGQAWNIVVAHVTTADGGAPTQIYSPDNWEETLFSGSVGGDGEIHLTEDQQIELGQRVASQPGKIRIVSGLSAMPLHPARWTGKADALIPEKVLDALNFAPRWARYR